MRVCMLALSAYGFSVMCSDRLSKAKGKMAGP
jgi:hypothetical protein